jgi:hypothetical protein
MNLKYGYAIICAPALAVLLAFQATAQTGSLKGKVKEAKGKSLEGVLIRATSAKNSDDRVETTSDEKGEFEFASLPGGEYSLSFTKQGYKTFTTRKLEIIPGETLKLRNIIELPRESDPYAVIRGAVLHGVGYTLPNATVTIERIDGGRKFKQETVSQHGGEFAFRLKSEKARYRITAEARGFKGDSIEIEVEGFEVRNVVLKLQPEK